MPHCSHIKNNILYNSEDAAYFYCNELSTDALRRMGHFAMNALHQFSMYEHALAPEMNRDHLVITQRRGTYAMHIEPFLPHDEWAGNHLAEFDRELSITVRYDEEFIATVAWEQKGTLEDLGTAFLTGLKAFDRYRYEPGATERMTEAFFFSLIDGKPSLQWTVERPGGDLIPIPRRAESRAGV